MITMLMCHNQYHSSIYLRTKIKTMKKFKDGPDPNDPPDPGPDPCGG